MEKIIIFLCSGRILFAYDRLLVPVIHFVDTFLPCLSVLIGIFEEKISFDNFSKVFLFNAGIVRHWPPIIIQTNGFYVSINQTRKINENINGKENDDDDDLPLMNGNYCSVSVSWCIIIRLSMIMSNVQHILLNAPFDDKYFLISKQKSYYYYYYFTNKK